MATLFCFTNGQFLNYRESIGAGAAATALFFNGWSGPYHLVILLIGQNMAGRGREREAIASDKDGRYCIPDDRCSQAY